MQTSELLWRFMRKYRLEKRSSLLQSIVLISCRRNIVLYYASGGADPVFHRVNNLFKSCLRHCNWMKSQFIYAKGITGCSWLKCKFFSAVIAAEI